MADYDRIRVLWPDHLGIARGKYLPARIAHRGTAFCASTMGLGYDRSMHPVPGSFLLEGLRDVSCSFDPAAVRPGWDNDRTGVVVGHLDLDGAPYRFAPRFALQKAAADWEALGYRAKVGLELEAYVMQPGPDGGWERWATPRSYVYATGRGADPLGVVDDIVCTAEATGLRMESVNAEFDEAQFELTLEYDDALAAVDDAFLFRVLARETALRHGLDLTFLGKPFAEVAGSGIHVNFSLTGPGDDRNAFDDPQSDDGLSSLAKDCLKGLVAHHLGMTALCAPTVNAYRRLRPAQLAGYWANWGLDHRCATNRVPHVGGPATRIENRMADGSANLHIAVAAVLQAARLGTAQAGSCPEPLTSDGFDDVNTEVHSAEDLAAALDDLENDPELRRAVGDEVCDNFLAIKRIEWGRYIGAVGAHGVHDPPTAWELDEYLMYH